METKLTIFCPVLDPATNTNGLALPIAGRFIWNSALLHLNNTPCEVVDVRLTIVA